MADSLTNPSPSSSSSSSPSMDIKTLLHFYTTQLLRRILGVLPSYDSLTNLSNSYLRSSRARSWRRKPGLPLPLPSNSLESSLVLTEGSRIFDVLEDVLDRVFSDLNNIQKNLEFWNSRAEGTNAQKVYHMILERGPLAFLDGTFRLVRGCVTRGPHLQNLYRSSAAHIAERVAMLTYLRQCLATFLAQVYMEIDKYGEDLVRDTEKSLPTLLVDINSLFSELEESLTNTSPLHEGGSSVRVDGSNTYLLQFEKLPEISEEGSQWTDCEIRDAINLIYQNLNKLDSYLSLVVTKYRKPRKTTLYWFRYTCGAVGLSVCSVWILRHSRFMGSSDIDNWIREGRDSTVSFWKDHVEMPLLSIRDELFETFRKRHKGVMELEEVKLTADSLHRMLLAFSEQTRGQTISPNASDQEMMEIVMGRYEKEMIHPIRNLVGGEIAHALLIQIQKLKLDVETAMLELDQILKANEINFAVLAALPAFFVSLIMIMGIRAWLKQDRGAEGRGRVARIQRRLLVVDVEKRIVQFQTCVNNGQEEDARYLFGLVLYSLDRLYRAVESHAKETGEWTSLRQDIIDLGKPKLQTEYKLILTSRLERLYDCLLPASNRR